MSITLNGDIGWVQCRVLWRAIRNLSNSRRIGNLLYGYGHSKAGRSKHACGSSGIAVQLEKRTCSDGKMGLSLHPLLATVWEQATERRVVLPPLWEQAMASNHGNQVSTFRNEILASLSDDDIKALRPTLSRVSLVSQQVLHERATPIADVFFIENGIASLAADTLDEGQVEVGLTGWEGFVGASVVLNPDAFRGSSGSRPSGGFGLPYECGGAPHGHQAIRQST
jgi:hypothetical protein